MKPIYIFFLFLSISLSLCTLSFRTLSLFISLSLSLSFSLSLSLFHTNTPSLKSKLSAGRGNSLGQRSTIWTYEHVLLFTHLHKIYTISIEKSVKVLFLLNQFVQLVLKINNRSQITRCLPKYGIQLYKC